MGSTGKHLIRQACIDLSTYTPRDIHHHIQDETRCNNESPEDVPYRRGVTYRQVVRYLRTDPESLVIQHNKGEILYRFQGNPHAKPIDQTIQDLKDSMQKLQQDHSTLKEEHSLIIESMIQQNDYNTKVLQAIRRRNEHGKKGPQDTDKR